MLLRRSGTERPKRDLVHTTGSGVHPKWPTPRGVVHTTTSGIYLKWSIPPGVVHTTTSGLHPKWPTPPPVACTQSGLHHEAWSPPPPVACTQSGLHHEVWSAPAAVAYTQSGPTRCSSGTNSLHRWSAAITPGAAVDSLTILRWVKFFEFIYPEANAHVSLIWLIIHFQQTQSSM